MPTKRAKLFLNSGSQAVRLPAEFRFAGEEVFVRRGERTGEVILSPKKGWRTWSEYLDLRDSLSKAVSEKFLRERPLNRPLAKKPFFSEDN